MCVSFFLFEKGIYNGFCSDNSCFTNIRENEFISHIRGTHSSKKEKIPFGILKIAENNDSCWTFDDVSSTELLLTEQCFTHSL